MTDNRLDIYRDRVLSHSREPHNRYQMTDADREVVGNNPLCGDKVTIYLRMAGNTIEDASFEGSACAITTASASMLTDALKGTTLSEAHELINAVNGMFTDGELPTDPRLEALQALESVRKYPSRVKCATLPWSAAATALDRDQTGSGADVTTE